MREQEDTGLVVPIRVEALLVSYRDAFSYQHFMPPYADFTQLPRKGQFPQKPYLSNVALSQPFTGAAALPQGMHLHWQLPKALRQGQTDEAGNLLMPAVPDRWLVTRVILTSQGELKTRSWVVESNYVSLDSTYSTTNIPYAPTTAQPQPYRYLGRVYDYADWVAHGNQGPEYYAPLTAMGFGIPDFSSYYPNCGNVFGLHDAELNAETSFDPATETLSYLVTGWYSLPTDDPLHDGTLTGLDNAFGWLFAGTGRPTYTLLHGCIRAAQWNPATNFTYFPDGNNPLGTTLALGNTPDEAIAALSAAQQPGAGPHTERLLNIFQRGTIHQLDQPGGLADAEEEVFNNEFTAFQGGTDWQIQAAPNKKTGPVDAAVAAALIALNQRQSDLDEARRQATALQGRLYADWNKFMLIQYAANKQGLPDLNAVYAYINAELARLNDLTAQIGADAAQIDTMRAALAGQLPDTQVLAAVPGPRYYQPNDPVLLLTGDGVPAPPPDNAANALCVLTTDLLAALALPAGLVTGSGAATISEAWLPPLVPDPAGLPYPAIGAAAQASLLAVPEAAALWVTLLAAQGGSTNPAVLDAAATRQALVAAQQAWLAAAPPPNGIAFAGSVPQPDIAYRPWTAEPWNPMAISWRFGYLPLVTLDHTLQSSYPADTVLRKLTFDPGSFNYEYPAGTSFSAQLQQYQGTALLSSAAATNLKTASRQLARYGRDAGLAEQDTVPMLAQALSGFHAALLMQQPTMQLPVADPLAGSQIYWTFSNVTVPAAVADQNQQTPQLNFLYNPFRAGAAMLNQLWLIDSFGRYRPINPNYLKISETIPTDPQTLGGNQPPKLYLPPRLAQPARLDFRWLLPDASAPLSSAPGQSPVCGWVVPNHLDGSLMFYDADGSAIGSLFTAVGGSVLYWTNAPGTAAFDADINTAFAQRNAVLRQFALATYANGAAYVQGLLRTFDETKTTIVPNGYPQDNVTAVLIGTPMALVQTTLDLTLLGLPAPDQSYNALQLDMGRKNPLDRSIFGFGDVRFPVLMGSLNELNDGLYGYFLPTPDTGPGTYDFSTFYAAAANGDDPRIKAPAADTLTLTTGATTSQPLALLIDPRCEIHAYCGVLPVKALTMPTELYATALSHLRFTFLTAPVLWPGTHVALPLPSEADGTWTWQARRADGTWLPSTVATLDQKATLENAGAIAEGWLQVGPNTNP